MYTCILFISRSVYLSQQLIHPQISVDIIQQQTGKDDEFIYGLALKRAHARSASSPFCITHEAFKEIVAEAPAIEAKIKLLHYETKRAVDQAKTHDYASLMCAGGLAEDSKDIQK